VVDQKPQPYTARQYQLHLSIYIFCLRRCSSYQFLRTVTRACCPQMALWLEKSDLPSALPLPSSVSRQKASQVEKPQVKVSLPDLEMGESGAAALPHC
jgi:hypothetical protein